MNPLNPRITLNRRAFLGRASQGLGALALASLVNPALLRAASASGPPKRDKWNGVVNPYHFPPKVRRVIWLTMAGAPSLEPLTTNRSWPRCTASPCRKRDQGEQITQLREGAALLGRVSQKIGKWARNLQNFTRS
jgi:hypothetical protein